MESASALHCPDAKRNLLDDLNRLFLKNPLHRYLLEIRWCERTTLRYLHLQCKIYIYIGKSFQCKSLPYIFHMNIGHVFRAENTLLPPPSEKEAVAVFLRLTGHFFIV